MTQIIIRSNDWPRETHTHRCPYCKRMVNEPNDLCQKTLLGTGLEFHVYPCLRDSADIRRRLGSDWLEAAVDTAGAARLTHVWPEQRVQQREEGEAENNVEIANVLEEAKKI